MRFRGAWESRIGKNSWRKAVHWLVTHAHEKTGLQSVCNSEVLKSSMFKRSRRLDTVKRGLERYFGMVMSALIKRWSLYGHGSTSTVWTRDSWLQIKTSSRDPDLKVDEWTNWWRLKLSKNSTSLALAGSESGPSRLQLKSPVIKMGSDEDKRTRWSCTSKQLKSAETWLLAWRGGLYTAHSTNLRPTLLVTDIHKVSSLHELHVHTDWSLLTLKSALLRTASPPYPRPSDRSALYKLYPGKCTYLERVSGFNQVSERTQMSQFK